ncbi:DUF2550 family protein [Corynebacterium poyangense]|uniref:DUF2550 family protein n=1 Tax=Corynebacterium poyangense TaxID=2684405 RepID=A0A7H0SND5_9CORY|nr:DUF2550 domain-containing protein [Corynebacterium poyangense]MBZ8177088.1 DUF2550 family protein [Corynebacterium poyangense]QNQ90060.1 DUF2550 family protein [Corynebacterium poyangense]
MGYVTWCMVILLFALCSLGMWRFFMLRSRGTTVVLRRLPAEGLHGWRHGILHYRRNDLDYYKLRSLSPLADLVVHRSEVAVIGRRATSEPEASFLPPDLHILKLQIKNHGYELAINTRGEMALTAWLESAPDIRQERMDPKSLRKHLHP